MGSIDPKGGGCNMASVAVVTTVLHEFAESLGTAVDAKDHHTSQHSEEVAEVAHALALRMGLPSVQADIIHVAAHLHDVGKIGVPDAILKKPEPLTKMEWEQIALHPVMGANIIRPVRQLRECGVLEMILHHHERWDGTGYPERLRGHAIPLGARIITVADALSAMLQDRPYRPAMTFFQASEEIIAQAGRQFDPKIVSVFTDSMALMKSLMQTLRLTGQQDVPSQATLETHRPKVPASRNA